MSTTNTLQFRRCSASGVNAMLPLKHAALACFCALLSLSGPVSATNFTGTAELVHQGTAHDIVYGISAGPRELIAVGTAGTLLRSSDGGSWKAERLETNGRALFSVASGEGYAVTVGQEGLIMRSDNTLEWEPVSAPTDQRLFSVAVDGQGNCAAVGGFGTIIVSRDKGVNWTSRAVDWQSLIDQPYEPHIYKVIFDEKGRLLMVGEFGMIARSDDLGESWELLRKGDASIFDITQTEDGTIYAVGQNGEVVRSTDDGSNWVQLATTTNGVLLNALVSQKSELIVFGLRENLVNTSNTQDQLSILQAHSELGNAWYTDNTAFGDSHYIVGQFGRIVKLSN